MIHSNNPAALSVGGFLGLGILGIPLSHMSPPVGLAGETLSSTRAVGAHLANAAATGVCELYYWRDRNREVAWDRGGLVPSGWGAASNPTVIDKAVHYFYEKLQYRDSEAAGRAKPYS